MHKHNFGKSRRTFLLGGVAALAAPVVLRPSRAKSNSGSVTIMSFGGSYQDATVKAVYDPFTKETGIKVDMVPYTGLAKVKAMELTGNVEVDIFFSDTVECATGSRHRLWEKLDLSTVKLDDLAVKPTDDYVCYELTPKCITWDPAKFSSTQHPTIYSEYFDLKKFPGRRALQTMAQGILEIALLGEGLAPKDVYPLNLDRAFKMLDSIKKQVLWAATTPQTISLVQTGEVNFSIANSNRVRATTFPGGGVPLQCAFKQNFFTKSGLAVLKGAPNKENAARLVDYYLRPETQKELMTILGTHPVSKTASANLPAEAQKWQGDLAGSDNLIISDTYWAENFDAVNQRFQEWRLT